MRILSLLLLAIVALCGFAVLAGGHWLGVLAGPGICLQFTQPALLVEADQPIPAAALRATLRAAGMPAEGAILRRTDRWPMPDPFAPSLPADVLVAIEVPAEAARSLARLPSGFRLDRTAAGAALHATLPDRGALTRTLAWPVLQWQMTRLISAGSHVPEGVLLRESGDVLSVRVRLRDIDRGQAAPLIGVPALRVPVLP